MRIAVPDLCRVHFALVSPQGVGTFQGGDMLAPPPDSSCSSLVWPLRGLLRRGSRRPLIQCIGLRATGSVGRRLLLIDTRRGDGPPGAGNYYFAALAAKESLIKAAPERIEAVIRAVVLAQSVIQQDPLRAAEVARRLFPAVEGELMGHILVRDAGSISRR